MRPAAILIFFTVFLTGSTSYPIYELQKDLPIFDKNKPLADCPIEGTDARQAIRIRKWLSIMPGEVQRAIDRITIHQHKDDTFKGLAVAYCRKTRGGKIEIHILANFVRPWYLWHEAAHAYEYRWGGDEEAWREAVGDGLSRKTSRTFPSRGVLTAYGMKHWQEDKADWVMEAYSYIAGYENSFSKIPDISDPRYTKKLRILFVEGLIGKSDYEKINRLLEAY